MSLQARERALVLSGPRIQESHRVRSEAQRVTELGSALLSRVEAKHIQADVWKTQRAVPEYSCHNQSIHSLSK
ncbi:hypothetical protein WJX73_000105 [Symbiochloris irregularis]|uniref:Uncharacterized protein n=1 Tax=Symbiochloris irregularis TaxID=706552 RepID=A0AAW1P1W2_9CHLO